MAERLKPYRKEDPDVGNPEYETVLFSKFAVRIR